MFANEQKRGISDEYRRQVEYYWSCNEGALSLNGFEEELFFIDDEFAAQTFFDYLYKAAHFHIEKINAETEIKQQFKILRFSKICQQTAVLLHNQLTLEGDAREQHNKIVKSMKNVKSIMHIRNSDDFSSWLFQLLNDHKLFQKQHFAKAKFADYLAQISFYDFRGEHPRFKWSTQLITQFHCVLIKLYKNLIIKPSTCEEEVNDQYVVRQQKIQQQLRKQDLSEFEEKKIKKNSVIIIEDSDDSDEDSNTSSLQVEEKPSQAVQDYKKIQNFEDIEDIYTFQAKNRYNIHNLCTYTYAEMMNLSKDMKLYKQQFETFRDIVLDDMDQSYLKQDLIRATEIDLKYINFILNRFEQIRIQRSLQFKNEILSKDSTNEEICQFFKIERRWGYGADSEAGRDETTKLCKSIISSMKLCRILPKQNIQRVQEVLQLILSNIEAQIEREKIEQQEKIRLQQEYMRRAWEEEQKIPQKKSKIFKRNK